MRKYGAGSKRSLLRSGLDSSVRAVGFATVESRPGRRVAGTFVLDLLDVAFITVTRNPGHYSGKRASGFSIRGCAMQYEIACGCGKSIPVTDAMAGSSQNCECGQTVVVPPLSTLRATEVAHATDPPAADPSAPDRPAPVVKPVGEIIAPTKISLREDGRAERGRRTVCMAALTPDALWIQDTARLRLIALQELEIAQPVNGAELAISPAPPGGGEKLTLTFDDATQAKRWYDRIQTCQSRLSPAEPSDGRRVPEVVALVRRARMLRTSNLDASRFCTRLPRRPTKGPSSARVYSGRTRSSIFDARNARRSGGPLARSPG